MELDHRDLPLTDEKGNLNPDYVAQHEGNMQILSGQIEELAHRLDKLSDLFVPVEYDSPRWHELSGEQSAICHQLEQKYKHRAILTTFYRRALVLAEERRVRRSRHSE